MSETRRNPEMEKYVKIRPVVTEDGEQFVIDLHIDNQRFQVGQYPDETIEGAIWMRDMLCIALAKLVAEHRLPAPPVEAKSEVVG